jgi:hypothetical protein
LLPAIKTGRHRESYRLLWRLGIKQWEHKRLLQGRLLPHRQPATDVNTERKMAELHKYGVLNREEFPVMEKVTAVDNKHL